MSKNPSLTQSHAWPRISIITPSYNQGQYLEETILSVLQQEYPNLEYMIIDGGSTDNSIEIIQKYEQSLTYWVSEPDRGQADAINKGFQRCTGDLITYMCSDDIYLPGTFTDVAKRYMQQHDCGAIVGGFIYIDERSEPTSEPRPASISHQGPIDLSLGPPGNYRLHQVSTFFTRTALDDVGRYLNPDLRYTMDREILYRIAQRHRIMTSPEVYGAFRLHPTSKSVAEILPFSKEFGRLHLMFLSDNPTENKKRKQMARYHRARGYIKYAKQSENFLSSVEALLFALIYMPSYLFQRSYIKTWIETLKILLRPTSQSK